MSVATVAPASGDTGGTGTTAPSSAPQGGTTDAGIGPGEVVTSPDGGRSTTRPGSETPTETTSAGTTDTGAAGGTAPTDPAKQQPRTDQATGGKKPLDGQDLPPDVRKYIEDLRKENKGYRETAQKASAEKKATDDRFAGAVEAFMKGLGLVQDEPEQLTPEVLEKRLGEATAKAAEVGDQHRQALTKLAVYDSATEHGANARELLDSVSFVNKITKLDPSSDDFGEQVTHHILAALEANPDKYRLAAPPAATPAPSGGEFGGGTGGQPDPDSLSVDQLRKRLHSNAST